MKQAIRALSIATTVLWILVVLFSATSIYSALKLSLGFGRPRASVSSEVLTVSLPFYIDNGGFYDLSDLNITTDINNHDGALISDSTTLVPLISRGSRVEENHNISVSWNDIISKDLTILLFQDSVFNIDISVKLKYAHAIPLQLSTNTTMPWGAPLANLSIGEISFTPINFTHFQVNVPFSFENHSFFALDGSVRLDLVDDRGGNVSSGATNINVASMNRCASQLEVVFRIDAGIPTEARVYFETSAFSFGPLVIPIV